MPLNRSRTTISGFKKRRSGFEKGLGGGFVAASGKTAERDLRPIMGMRGMLRGGGRILPSPTMERSVSGRTLRVSVREYLSTRGNEESIYQSIHTKDKAAAIQINQKIDLKEVSGGTSM